MTTTTEVLVTRYWRSWQGDRPNWSMMRSCLADILDVEAGAIAADDLVAMASQGTRWRDVKLIDAVYTDNKAAIFYRGVDTVTNEMMEIAEFLTIASGKITRLRSSLPPPSR